MKKRSLKLISLMLAMIFCLLVFAAACEEEKYDSFIEAGSVQRVQYDGSVHYPAARLNHEETELVFEGGDAGAGGCVNPGSYNITIYAPETENFKAASKKVILIVEDAPALNDDVFAQLVERMKAGGDFELDECIAIDVSLAVQFNHQNFSLRDKDWKYTFSIEGNLDFTSPKETLLKIGLYDKNNEALIEAVYDGEASVIYLSTPEKKYRIENARLVEALLSASGADMPLGGVDAEKLGEHLYNAAATVLSSGEVSADGDVFTFDFHMDNLLTSTVGAVAEAFMPGVGQQLGRLLYSTVKEDIWSGMQAADLPALRGTLEISFDGDKFAGVDLYDMDYVDQAEEGVFLSEVSPVTLGNGRLDVKDLLPSGVAGYVPTKMVDINASGTLDILTGDEISGSLGWSVKTDLDLAEFVISGGDFSAEEMRDNMFHLSLWYDPSASSSSKWAGSGDRAQALSKACNLLDIVFDPRNTGTSMVYVSFAPLTLMNEEMIGMIESMSSGEFLGQTAYDMVRRSFNDYSMIQLDINAVVRSMAFREGEDSEAFDALGGAVGFLSRLMAAISVENGAGGASIDDIARVLDGDFGEDPMLLGVSLGSVLKAVFSVDGETGQTLRVNVDKFEMFSTDNGGYDAVESGLVKNFNGESKVYYDHNGDSIDDTPVLTPHIEGYTDASGKFFIDLYNQSLPNLVEGKVYDAGDAAYSALSAQEVNAINEFAIGYTYTDIYGNNNDNIYTARIIRIEGFDPEVTGPQYVTIYTEPIEGYNILTNFDNLLRAISDKKISFEGYCVSGWININAELKSASARSLSFSAEAVDEYSGGEPVEIAAGEELLMSSQFFLSKQYRVRLTYADGRSKEIYIDAEASDFTVSDPSKAEYYEESPASGGGLINGTRKFWRAKAAGEIEMKLKTPLYEFVWKVKII